MKTPPSTVTVAHSPDSDDAFMFYALATNKVGLPGVKFTQLDRIALTRRETLISELSKV